MCREIKQHSKTFILRRFFEAAFLFGENGGIIHESLRLSLTFRRTGFMCLA